MSDEVMAALIAWVDGMSVDDIKNAIASSANASSIRDPDCLAKFLYAKANGLA